ncbi:hypothetical protein GOP47_0031120, partial [Adiantum capillus-veneris]
GEPGNRRRELSEQSKRKRTGKMYSNANLRLATLQNQLSSSSPLSDGAKFLQAADRLGFKVEPNVRRAIFESSPVVALESTIITHGMPYPQNVQTAKEVEGIIVRHGAVPATIAILKGIPCIGLSVDELEELGQNGSNFTKTARRDISHVVARKGNGATTVSATMFFAAKVGIHIFVTGGIGGVHRGGENTMDVSSDLTELGRTPVAVICAGIKSILDIPRTLEYLETQGVPVVGYGVEEFPAFFTRKSGCKVPCRVSTPNECAEVIVTSLALELQGGVLVGVPIPEEHAAAAQPIELAIERALQEAKEQDVSGSAITPFLLKRVSELTGGASLGANIELMEGRMPRARMCEDESAGSSVAK